MRLSVLFLMLVTSCGGAHHEAVGGPAQATPATTADSGTCVLSGEQWHCPVAVEPARRTSPRADAETGVMHWKDGAPAAVALVKRSATVPHPDQLVLSPDRVIFDDGFDKEIR